MPLEPKQLFLYRKYLMRKIKTLWATDDFHESRRRRWLYHYDGKYSPEFTMNILWVVRLIYCYAPPAYFTMDGADTSPYNPEFSNYPCPSHAPGLNIKTRMRHGPPFPRDIIQSLSFEDNEDFEPKLLFRSSYGGHYQSAFENHIQQLKSKPSASAEVWKKAMDIGGTYKPCFFSSKISWYGIERVPAITSCSLESRDAGCLLAQLLWRGQS